MDSNLTGISDQFTMHPTGMPNDNSQAKIILTASKLNSLSRLSFKRSCMRIMYMMNLTAVFTLLSSGQAISSGLR